MRNDFIKVKLEREINPLAKYDEIKYFSNNFYLVKSIETNLYGIINHIGREEVPCLYEKEKLITFLTKKENEDIIKDDSLIVCKKEGMSGYKNLNNKLVIPFDYQKAYPFSEDLAAVKIDFYWGFINKENQLIIPFMYNKVRSFSEDLAAVNLNNLWGFIDKTNQVTIPFLYEEAFSFVDGYAVVKENGEYSFIDKTGHKLTNNIVETIFIKDNEDIPDNTKKIQILEYLSIFEFSNKSVIIREADLDKYLESIANVEKTILEDKVDSIKIKKLK